MRKKKKRNKKEIKEKIENQMETEKTIVPSENTVVLSEKPIILDQNNDIAGQDIKKVKKKNHQKKTKNLVFLCIWTYFVLKTFITDIDLLVAKELGVTKTSLYVFLRLLIFVTGGFLLWIKLGNKRFWKNVGLFFLFPVYPVSWTISKNVFWKVPKYLFNKKHQVALFYYIEGVIAFFVDFKYILLRATLFTLACIILFTFNSNWIIISIIIFGTLQILHLLKRFKQTFSPIRIFRIKFDFSQDSFNSQLSPEQIEKNFNKGLSQENSEKEEIIIKKMEHFLLMAEFYRAFNLKVKEVVNNRTYMLSFLGKAMLSFILAMIYFGGINYGIFKLHPDAFKVEFKPGFFDFFYYSFFTVFPDGTDIEPLTVLSKSVRMLGAFIGVLINLLLLAVYLTISNEKYKENLNQLANFTDQHSAKIDQYFKDKYGHEPSEGLKKLKNISSTLETAMNFFNSLVRKG